MPRFWTLGLWVGRLTICWVGPARRDRAQAAAETDVDDPPLKPATFLLYQREMTLTASDVNSISFNFNTASSRNELRKNSGLSYEFLFRVQASTIWRFLEHRSKWLQTRLSGPKRNVVSQLLKWDETQQTLPRTTHVKIECLQDIGSKNVTFPEAWWAGGSPEREGVSGIREGGGEGGGTGE